MKYLITIKLSPDAEPAMQGVVEEHEALNIVREAIRNLQALDETSADLKALNFMWKIKPGKPMVIENTKNNRVIIVQEHHEK